MNPHERHIRRFGLAMIFYALATIGLVWFFDSITPQAQANLQTAQFSLALDETAWENLAADPIARNELKTFLIWDSAAFVPLYLAFLLVTSFALSRFSSGWTKTAAWLIAIAAASAAFADWTENFRFYELLEPAFADAEKNIAVVGWAAHVKWIALFIATAVSSALFWRGGWWKVAAILLLTTSLAGLFGLVNYRPLIGFSLAAQLLILLVGGAALTFSATARRSFLQSY